MAITFASAATDLVKTITACRSCGSGSLDEVLDLGTHAVSDFYETVPADELRAPLCLVQCGGCGLVQLTHSVSRDRLYNDYWYRSGLNPAMVAALKDVVKDAMGRVTLMPDDGVLDIGANDGTLLDQYPRPSRFRTEGVEPSGLWELALAKGHTMTNGYYPEEWSGLTDEIPFRIITSIAMFYDLDDPNAFVQAIKEDLHPDGIWVNQMMDLEGMIGANAFDNICHEHVAYWRVEDFYHIVRDHGLRVESFSHNAVNGGSVRLIVRHGEGIYTYAENSYHNALRAFARRLPLLRGQCLDFLEAAIKNGKITAGSHIPIISEAEMRQRRPDYLLVLPWSQPFLDGFLEREKGLIAQGTRLVAPLPTFRILGG